MQGYNDCTDAWTDINQDFPNWKTANPAIATTTNLGLHTGMSVGATTSSTYGYVVKTNGRNGCYEVQEPLSGPTNVASLGCPASTTRGSSVTCTLSGSSGETISSWKFTDANGNTVTRTSNPTSTTWSGVMVASGTVAATAGGSPVSANIAVNNRTNFAFTAVNPSSEPNGFSGDGCSITIPSPPAQSGAAAGKFCLNQQATVNTQTVSDNGPNNGYSYVTSITNVNGNLTTGYFYVISPDLQNGSSAFYLAQCGTYNAQSNPNGFISGANLLTNTIRHESGTVQSHYENYVTAQNNSANNIGTTAEGMVGLEVAQTLANNVVTAINQDRQTILSAAQVEPCSVQENAACVFQGFVNFLPYQSCN